MPLQNYYCAYIGAFGDFSCNPRTLGSSHLNRMVSLEGIVTKCSLVRPKVIQSVHYSEKKDRFLSRKYRDQTMTASGATSLNVYPQEDEDKNPVSTIRSPSSDKNNRLIYLAHYRVRLLHLYGSPVDFDPRNARASPGRSTASQRRRYSR
jgi:hypothetical protein